MRRIILVIFAMVVGLILVALAVLLLLFGPDRPEQFEGAVAARERQFMNPAPQGVVLLTGSSYFELWETSDEDLEGLDTVNIGIAGTKIGDQIHYFDRLVVPFRPRALVVYAGSNDISGVPFFSKPAAEVVPLVKTYVDLVHDEFPGLPVYYVAITEAPIRQGVRDEIQQANQMLRDWADQSGEITFIDTAPALLTPSGDIDPSLFRADQLHLNAEGYAKFSAVIRDALTNETGR